MAITTYADTSDLACTVLDADVAEKMIERASLMVTKACGTTTPDEDAARMVVCLMVERALASPTAEEFGPTPQTLQSISTYSNTWTWGNPVGDLYIRKSELQMLGVAAYAAFAVPSYGKLDTDYDPIWTDVP
jgi:hypothetical protein